MSLHFTSNSRAMASLDRWLTSPPEDPEYCEDCECDENNLIADCCCKCHEREYNGPDTREEARGER